MHIARRRTLSQDQDDMDRLCEYGILHTEANMLKGLPHMELSKSHLIGS